jgi:hypothetical protein
MANVNSFLLRSPFGSELTSERRAELESWGWMVCPVCDVVHAAFLKDSHMKLCQGPGGLERVNPDTVPWGV